jgi:hypothetical protein
MELIRAIFGRPRLWVSALVTAVALVVGFVFLPPATKSLTATPYAVESIGVSTAGELVHQYLGFVGNTDRSFVVVIGLDVPATALSGEWNVDILVNPADTLAGPTPKKGYKFDNAHLQTCFGRPCPKKVTFDGSPWNDYEVSGDAALGSHSFDTLQGGEVAYEEGAPKVDAAEIPIALNFKVGGPVTFAATSGASLRVQLPSLLPLDNHTSLDAEQLYLAPDYTLETGGAVYEGPFWVWTKTPGDSELFKDVATGSNEELLRQYDQGSFYAGVFFGLAGGGVATLALEVVDFVTDRRKARQDSSKQLAIAAAEIKQSD